MLRSQQNAFSKGLIETQQCIWPLSAMASIAVSVKVSCSMYLESSSFKICCHCIANICSVHGHLQMRKYARGCLHGQNPAAEAALCHSKIPSPTAAQVRQRCPKSQTCCICKCAVLQRLHGSWHRQNLSALKCFEEPLSFPIPISLNMNWHCEPHALLTQKSKSGLGAFMILSKCHSTGKGR